MGTSQEQKNQSRASIVEAASRLFRERGVDAVSVAQVMEAAGLTHGGFPRHFASKQDLVNAALALAADEQSKTKLSDDFEAFARTYLSRSHRDHPESGCVFAALGSEISRAPDETRHVLSERIQQQVETFGDDPDRQAAALGRWSTLIGAMVLARLVETEELSDQILAAARTFVGVVEE